MTEPKLYLMLGYPGAGKTTAAEVIHELTGATHLSSDKLRLDMFKQPIFTTEEHEILYKELDKQTKELLSAGKDVIYDANLNRLVHRQEKYDICAETGAKPILIWVQTPRDLAKQRASHEDRQHLVPKNESSADMFDRIAGIIEPPEYSEEYISLDGTKITADYIRQTLKL